jgi:hypothetical protein
MRADEAGAAKDCDIASRIDLSRVGETNGIGRNAALPMRSQVSTSIAPNVPSIGGRNPASSAA